MDVVRIEDIQGLIVDMRDQSVIMDCDVAKIYDVETREVKSSGLK